MLTPPRIKISAGLPFHFAMELGAVELRKAPTSTGHEMVLNYLEVALKHIDEKTWRLGEDGGLLPGYESIVASGYELVDLGNPTCDDTLRSILESLAKAPGVELMPTPEEVPLGL